MPPAGGRLVCTYQSLTEARAKVWQAALVAKVLYFVPEAPARRTRLPASVEEVISPYWDPVRSKIEPCPPKHFSPPTLKKTIRSNLLMPLDKKKKLSQNNLPSNLSPKISDAIVK